MKKKFNFFIAIVSLVIISVNVLSACSPSNQMQTYLAYTVIFNDNYQGNYAKEDVKAGEKVTLPKEPTRVGYTFKGWYLSNDEAAAVAFDSAKPIANNVTVYAKWERNNAVSLITLKFLNYTTLDQTYSVTKGSQFALPQTPVYNEDKMYDFVNWYTDSACTQAYDFSASVNSDMVLYAGWVKTKAYIKLDYNYTACPAPTKVVVEIGKALDLTANTPSRNQYEFRGWYFSRVGGEAFDASKQITDDITLYAQWNRSEYMVSFDPNGATLADNTETSFEIKKHASAAEEAARVRQAMTFEGHDFDNWYTVKTDPDAEDEHSQEFLADLSSINEDGIYYAGWKLQEYTVSFNYNYEGAPVSPETQKVKYGKKATTAIVENREGYLFGGWFLDPSLNNQFTFDMSVSQNLTLYAKWVEDSGEQKTINVSYYYDIGGGNVSHAVKSIAFNGTADSNGAEKPLVKDFAFAGWYEDKAFTKKFNTNRNLTEDITVYGKMLKKHTFEAEAINFENKEGQGSSNNSKEEGMIADYKFIEGGNVSNGFFVRELYYNAASLDFEIISDKDVTDAVLYLRVSSEIYRFATTKFKDGKEYNYLSEEELKIVVNDSWPNMIPGTWLHYGGLYMPMANTIENGDISRDKTPFEDMLIIEGLNLKAGSNLITMYVDNYNNHGGTFNAEAPIVDCMYIYSDAKLTMQDYKYYERENVVKG